MCVLFSFLVRDEEKAGEESRLRKLHFEFRSKSANASWPQRLAQWTEVAECRIAGTQKGAANISLSLSLSVCLSVCVVSVA